MTSIIKKREDRGSVLPLLTNRWLDVNDVKTNFKKISIPAYTGSVAKGEIKKDYEKALSLRKQYISKVLYEQNRDYANFNNYVEARHGDINIIDLPLSKDNPVLIDKHQIVSNEGHCGIVIINAYDENSDSDYSGYRNGSVYVKIKEDAILQLIVLQRYGKNTVNNLSIVADVEDGGALHITEVELGSSISNMNYCCDLSGYESRTTISTAYVASQKQNLDFFYNVRHYGQFTDSDIIVNGALLDEAKKSFRGTIDFVEGCSGSTGNEEEFSILMSEDVVSLATPLLLSHEDNVIGNHASSAGRLDEDMLFYLMTRGLNRKEAEGMVVEARMIPTLDRIPVEELRASIRNEIHERIVMR